MSAAFTPEHLGAPTTVSFSFQIHQDGQDPAPLTGVELAYPRGLGLATSDLGISACQPAQLEAGGPNGCPPDSHMGSGTALTEIAFGADLVKETVALTLFAGPSPNGYLHLLVDARGKFPIEAAIIMTAELRPGHLAITVPPIPSLPAAPYVALAEMHLTLGGHLTYYEMVRGHRVAYHPAGVGLPTVCPRGGFRFAAAFLLLDGERANSRAAVACPKTHRQ
ncbi:MAG TPA: hypothetical protein VGX26_02765 [Solirubrobacteraceae bacterium]|jgi:hypothetical protein|nr:hypothetical protein [Solirubrobacteraceae bacterium]